MAELLFDGSSADAVLNLATVEFRFGAVVMIKKLVFNLAYEMIAVAGSYFGTHGYTSDLFITSVSERKPAEC